MVKNPPAAQEMPVQSRGSGRSPGGGHGNPLSVLAWAVPWAEGPGGLQSAGPPRVGHDVVTALRRDAERSSWGFRARGALEEAAVCVRPLGESALVSPRGEGRRRI